MVYAYKMQQISALGVKVQLFQLPSLGVVYLEVRSF
jgi:hypothetical protein